MKATMISEFCGVEVYEVVSDDGEILFKEIDRDLHTIRWYEDAKRERPVDKPYWAH